jgi:uncharacterized protein (DUF1800 family)
MRSFNHLRIIRQISRDRLLACCLGVTLFSLISQPLLIQPVLGQPRDGAVGDRASSEPSKVPKFSEAPLSRDQKILHLLNRITFGPRPGDFERLRQMGPNAFLEQQLHPEKIDDSVVDTRIAQLPTLSMSNEQLAQIFAELRAERLAKLRDQQGSLQNEQSAADLRIQTANSIPGVRARATGKVNRDPAMMNGSGRPEEGAQGPRRAIIELAQKELLRAVYSHRQLQEEMVQFWMNHFNIFAPKGADRWLMTSYERDTIRPHAMGKFEDLLVATAESPAMLFYLDNWLSSTPNPPPGFRNGLVSHPFGVGFPLARGPFPQAPRFSPNRPGQMVQPPARRRNGLNENYGRELMELHTLGVQGGYTQKDVIEVARCLTGWTINSPNRGGEFIFNPRFHDQGDKSVLGHKINGRQGMAGIQEGLEVLHILAHHPSTAHFISLKLCRRFISDDPPASLVDRASQTFLRTDGDIRAVLKTILTSPEFYSQTAYRTKVKSPLELVASSVRALGTDTDAGIPLLQFIARMGQPMFQYQAPAGFPDRSSTWINSAALLMRMNYALALTANQIRGTPVDFSRLDSGQENVSINAVLNDLSKELLNGTLSSETRELIVSQLNARSEAGRPYGTSNPQKETSILAALVLASPDFQKR